MQEYYNFVRYYINNIIIFLKTIQKHIKYLKIIFDLFFKKFIKLKLKKLFIDYSSVILLNYQINSFILFKVEEKITTIYNLEFFKNLTKLKYYIELTDFLQYYVSYFIIIVNILKN